MLTPEKHERVTDLGDKLLALYAKRDEAVQAGNLDHVQRLQTAISEVSAQRQEILRSVKEK